MYIPGNLGKQWNTRNPVRVTPTTSLLLAANHTDSDFIHKQNCFTPINCGYHSQQNIIQTNFKVLYTLKSQI